MGSAENLKVGQFQNNFGRTLELQRQNNTSITGAMSNLNDVYMASETTNQSKRFVLVQSGTAMVAQANTQCQFLLQLLRSRFPFMGEYAPYRQAHRISLA